MSTLTCQHCTAPTNGVVLCSRCQHTARRALFNVRAYHEDLFNLPTQVFGTRRANRVSDPTGSAVGLASDPIEDAAADARRILLHWMRRVVQDAQRAHMPNSDSVDVLVRVLTQQLHAIAKLDWAGQFLTELVALEHQLRRVIEGHNGLWCAGPCGTVLDAETGAFCNRVLYADPDKPDVRCPVCGTVWPAAERRRILLERARDVETNIAVIARAALTLLDGEPSAARLEARIQKWADRGKLERRGSVDLDGHVRKVYRVGDVLDLLLDDTRSRPVSGRSA